MMKYTYGDLTITDLDHIKACTSPDYNFIFSKDDGTFMRWGETPADDPPYCKIGPEILDIEISVNGCPNRCSFCYKNNTSVPPKNMSFETFKIIIDKFNRVLCQVAFGITGIQTNPDFFKMMEYCREIGIIPNFTLSGIDLTNEYAEKAAKLVGALAVSAYKTDKNICYNTVKLFTDLGVKQTNIHLMVSNETLDFVYEVIDDRIKDGRLSNMNAIVFLGLKPKGRAKGTFSPVNPDEFDKIDRKASCRERV
jgi:MoaA/NifB/PqqE/SkfB family radical SAM enzyme